MESSTPFIRKEAERLLRLEPTLAMNDAISAVMICPPPEEGGSPVVKVRLGAGADLAACEAVADDAALNLMEAGLDISDVVFYRDPPRPEAGADGLLAPGLRAAADERPWTMMRAQLARSDKSGMLDEVTAWGLRGKTLVIECPEPTASELERPRNMKRILQSAKSCARAEAVEVVRPDDQPRRRAAGHDRKKSSPGSPQAENARTPKRLDKETVMSGTTDNARPHGGAGPEDETIWVVEQKGLGTVAAFKSRRRAEEASSIAKQICSLNGLTGAAMSVRQLALND